MNFTLKRNTMVGGWSLHSQYGYAYCPFINDDFQPCGTWCALFHWNKNRNCIKQICSKTSVFIEVEVQDETSDESSN